MIVAATSELRAAALGQGVVRGDAPLASGTSPLTKQAFLGLG